MNTCMCAGQEGTKNLVVCPLELYLHKVWGLEVYGTSLESWMLCIDKHNIARIDTTMQQSGQYVTD